MRLWQRFKLWYLGPEFPPDYIPLKRVGWSPIPGFRERTREYVAYAQAKRTFDLVATIEKEVKDRDAEQRHPCGCRREPGCCAGETEVPA